MRELYEKAKLDSSQRGEYFNKIQDLYTNDPHLYLDNLEYILKSPTKGIESFLEFLKEYELPLLKIDSVLELLEKIYPTINSQYSEKYKLALDTVKELKNKLAYCNAFRVYINTANNFNSDTTDEEICEMYFLIQKSIVLQDANFSKIINKYSIRAVPEIVALSIQRNEFSEVAKELMNLTEFREYYQDWLVVLSKVYYPNQSFSLVRHISKDIDDELDLDQRVDEIRERLTDTANDTGIGETAIVKLSNKEKNDLLKCIHFKENVMVCLDESRSYEIYKEIKDLYSLFGEGLDGDGVRVLGCGGCKIYTETPNYQKTGGIPDYLKNHHDLEIGEREWDKSKKKRRTSSKLDYEYDDDVEIRRTKSKLHDKLQTSTELVNELKSLINTQKADKAEEVKDDKPEEKKDDLSNESNSYYRDFMTSVNKTKITESAEEDDFDPDERPASDNYIGDVLSDVKSNIDKTTSTVNTIVDKGKGVYRSATAPFRRAIASINQTIEKWKNYDETRLKENLVDPHARKDLFSKIKSAIKLGALAKAGILLNPIFLALALSKKMSDNKKVQRLRHEIIGELKTELEVLDAKIRDADYDVNKAEKYRLMRLKNEINKKLIRVGGMDVTKIII